MSMKHLMPKIKNRLLLFTKQHDGFRVGENDIKNFRVWMDKEFNMRIKTGHTMKALNELKDEGRLIRDDEVYRVKEE